VGGSANYPLGFALDLPLSHKIFHAAMKHRHEMRPYGHPISSAVLSLALPSTRATNGQGIGYFGIPISFNIHPIRTMVELPSIKHLLISIVLYFSRYCCPQTPLTRSTQFSELLTVLSAHATLDSLRLAPGVYGYLSASLICARFYRDCLVLARSSLMVTNSRNSSRGDNKSKMY